MIPANAITSWATTAPWQNRAQVEQDLLLSRLIVEIANHPYLGQELIFRGGTCLHKLQLPAARRYSEDLDYVRSSPTGIKELTTAATEIGEALGFTVSTRIGEHPKIYLRTHATDGSKLRLKIEVDTHERAPANPTMTLPYSVNSPWWSGTAEVQTFLPAELIATKIRALYQRKKGRDLYDLWLALTVLDLNPADIIRSFRPYQPSGLTSKTAAANLRAKLEDTEFRNDLSLLVTSDPIDYDIDLAADLVITSLHDRL